MKAKNTMLSPFFDFFKINIPVTEIQNIFVANLLKNKDGLKFLSHKLFICFIVSNKIN